MIFRLLAMLCAAAMAFGAYEAQPKLVTPAEEEFQAELAKTDQDETQVELALEFLEKYPDNIPLGREAQNILNRKSDKPAEWYKERMDADPTVANRYLWARASGDAEIMKEQAAWIIENDPDNFWGHYLMAIGYWQQEEPDLEHAIVHFEDAVAKDPSRYEGFIWMGYALQEHGNLEKALEAFNAAEIVDTAATSPRFAKLEIYALQRDADKYFNAIDPMLPDAPVTEKLALANAESEAPVGFEGGFTVIESFTYW